MPAKAKTKVRVLPKSHLERIHNLDLTVVSYLDRAEVVTDSTGAERSEWLPRDIVGKDGKTLIVYRTDAKYAISGWEPWHDGMFGGRRENIHSALHWVETARGVRAGTIKDFLGA